MLKEETKAVQQSPMTKGSQPRGDSHTPYIEGTMLFLWEDNSSLCSKAFAGFHRG